MKKDRPFKKRKRALIAGISGQDGAYLAKLLLQKDYDVYGTSRDAQASSFRNLKILGVYDNIITYSMSLNDFRSVLQVILIVEPDEIYNLAGQSSVGLSFELPVETHESINMGTLNLLEAIRFLGKPIRFYNASSGECFGDTSDSSADETSQMHPKSPYAVAKASAFWQVANHRDSYGMFACSGLLFNHESPLRPKRFVTKKVISSALRISKGSKDRLRLGNLQIQRDWGWAPEYVDAMWRMLQQDQADDFVIATGKTYSLESFVSTVFSTLGLNWKDHVDVDQSLFRPSEIMTVAASPKKAHKQLGWKAKYFMPDIIRMIIEAELIKLNDIKKCQPQSPQE